MTNSTHNSTFGSADSRVDLLPQDELGGISVHADRFALFDAGMTSALEELQTRWSHKAAPADSRGSLRHERQQRS